MKTDKELTLKQKAKAICDDEYISLHPEKSTLDGEFSAKQLREIADLMDELKKGNER